MKKSSIVDAADPQQNISTSKAGKTKAKFEKNSIIITYRFLSSPSRLNSQEKNSYKQKAQHQSLKAFGRWPIWLSWSSAWCVLPIGSKL